MHSFLRDWFFDDAPRRLRQWLLMAVSLLSLLGITAPMHWFVAEVMAYGQGKSAEVTHVMNAVMLALMHH